MSENPEPKKKHVPFIPGWLDDLDLSLIAFRVYCTIARRDDFWESKTKLERRLKVSNRTLAQAFEELLSLGLILETPQKGNSTRYRIYVGEHYPPVPQSTTTQCQTAPPPSAQQHYKGNPQKVTPRKGSQKEHVTYSASAENGASPFPSDAAPLARMTEAEAQEAALEIAENEGANSDLVLVPPQRVKQWAIDWHIKSEQSGWTMNREPIRNATLALRGYLRKAAAGTVDRFQEFRDAGPRSSSGSDDEWDDEPPF